MLKVRVLGQFEVEKPGSTEPAPKLRRKSRALLAYLCLAEKALRRDHLSALFCHAANDPAGNLRWHISRLRRTLHPELFLVDRTTIQINAEVTWIDAQAFVNGLHSVMPKDPPETIAQLLDLYRGELLSGMGLSNANDFDFWLLGKRAFYLHLFETYALKLIQRQVDASNMEFALEWATRLFEHNPTLEDAHYWLVRLFSQRGQTDVALRQYMMYTQMMQDEFGTRPSDRMIEVYQQITDVPFNTHVGFSGTPRLDHPESTPETFVGRQDELTQLQRAWSQATGKITIFRIEGEAGIGKSALVNTFIDSVREQVPIFRAACYESTQSLALAPWMDVLRGYARYLRSSLSITVTDRLRKNLGSIVPELWQQDEGDAQSALDHHTTLREGILLNSIADFLVLGVSGGRVLIVIEDLHFADELTIQLLTLLLARLQSDPLFILTSQRQVESIENEPLRSAVYEWSRFEQHKTLLLKPLDDDTLVSLVKQLKPHTPAPEQLADSIRQHTMGVTLHIVETLHHLETGPSASETLPTPPSFARIVRRRLNRMTTEQQGVLAVLAVADYPFTLKEVVALVDQEEAKVIGALDQALIYRFVKTNGEVGQSRYELAHFLFRDVILEKVSKGRQQQLHRRIAAQHEVLIQRMPGPQRIERINRIVFHARLGDDADRLVRWTPLAAQSMAASSAYRQAYELCTLVQPTLERHTELSAEAMIRFYLEMVQLLRYMGDWKAQMTLLDMIRDWVEDGQLADEHLLARFHAEDGTNAFRQGEYSIAKASLQQAISIGERVGVSWVIAQAYGILGNVALYEANWDAAIRYQRQCLEICVTLEDALGTGKAYNNLGAIAFRQGQYDLAQQYHQQNLAIRETVDDQHGVATAHNNLGAIRFVMGDWSGANNHYQQALAIRQDLDDQHGIASTLSNIGQVYDLLGEPERAIEAFEKSLEIREEINDRAGVAHALDSLGNVYGTLGQFRMAKRYFEQSLQINRALGTRFHIAETMLSLSFTEAMLNDAQPHPMFYAGLALSLEIQSERNLIEALSDYAWLLIHAGRSAEAARYVGLLHQQRDATGNRKLSELLDWLSAALDPDTLQTEMAQGAEWTLVGAAKALLNIASRTKSSD